MKDLTKRIVSLYVEDGQTLRQIAHEIGITHQAVHYRIKQAGVQLRKGNVNKRLFVVDKDLLAELYVNKKLSMAEVAKRLKCSTTTVLRNLKKLEIPRRNGGPRPTAYAPIYLMKIGQEVLVPRPNLPYPIHNALDVGKRIGVELEAEVISDDLLLVTRLS